MNRNLYRYGMFVGLLLCLSACRKDMRLFDKEVRTTLEEFGKQNPETKLLVTTRLGDFSIKLYDGTPLHRANFVRLVKGGYYTDLFFYRIVYETAIQGGAEWMYRLDYDLPTEVNTAKYTHKRGAVAMAQYDPSMNPEGNTSASEFFIITNAEEARKFDGIYTVIGEVTQGMEVVDKIKEARAFNEKPVDPVKFSIRILE